MIRVRHLLTIVFIGLCTFVVAAADTEFTYQGKLNENGQVTNGSFDFEFALWDSLAGGNLVDSPMVINDVQVTDGRFTVELDYGANAFDNSGRWLEIVVDGVMLSPRQAVTRSPYSIQTRGIFVDVDHDVGIGTSTPNHPLHVEADADFAMVVMNNRVDEASAVYGRALGSGLTYGGYFDSASSAGGAGVYGQVTGTGANYGVHGRNFSTSGAGVFGDASATSGANYGVYGRSNSTSGRGVFGLATASTGGTNGGRFESNSTTGRGVYGQASSLTGLTYGGRFENHSTSGRGVYGVAHPMTGTTYGGQFRNFSTSGLGVHAEVTASTGITYGGWFESDSTSGRALFGLATANSGVNYGVVGHSNSSSGFDFWASGAGTNYGAPSSRRFKSNVIPIGDPLDKLAKLRGVYFDWDKEHGGAHDVGMIAEEVGGVMPEIVRYEENGVDAIGMDYSKMTPLLVEAVNALRSQRDSDIASFHAENDELRDENAALRDRLDSLERVMQRLATDEEKTSK